jgi:hypothetical protein
MWLTRYVRPQHHRLDQLRAEAVGGLPLRSGDHQLPYLRFRRGLLSCPDRAAGPAPTSCGRDRGPHSQ